MQTVHYWSGFGSGQGLRLALGRKQTLIRPSWEKYINNKMKRHDTTKTTIPNHKSRKQIERDSFLGHVKMHLAVIRKMWKTFALHIVLQFSNCQLPAKKSERATQKWQGERERA